MKKTLLLLLFTGFLQAQQLTEVVLNPPTGTDFPNEYIELTFPANATLGKYAVLAIEGDSATQKGFLDNKYDLNGLVMGSSGYLLLASTGHPYTVPATTTIATLITSTNLENSNNILLVSYTDPLPNLATDLDSNDDGVLELPAGMTLIDGVSVKGVATDFAYTPNVFDASILGYTPDILFKAPNQWQAADFTVESVAPTLILDGTKITRPDVGGQAATPGSMNPVSTAIHTEQPNQAQVHIYPNPFTSVFNIDANIALKKVEVYNLLGQKVYTTLQNEINLSAFPKGMYLVWIETEKGLSVQQMVKQ